MEKETKEPKKTFNEKAGVDASLLEELARMFDHPSKTNEKQEFHADVKKKKEGDKDA